jgi:HPt (histidine-containing phosphotransfer) domain-containing protein
VLEDLRSLTGRDGKAVLARVVAQTRVAQQEQLRELADALRSAEWTRAARAAHAVAGQAAVVGATHVAALARALQTRIEEADPATESLHSDAVALEKAWRAAEPVLEQETQR